MMRPIIFLGLIFCHLLGLTQSLERQAYLSGGDCVLVGTITYTYSFGEAVVGTDQSNLPALTMGFQQPQPIIVLAAGGLRLEAEALDMDAILHWSTEGGEMGGEFVIIRRLPNGREEIVGSVVGYQWQDVGLGHWQSSAEYLVEWRQPSGAILVSNWVSIRFPTSAESFQLYPNPTAGDAFLRLPLESGEPIQLSWFNLLGQAVSTQDFSYQSSPEGMPISTRSLPAGTYWLWVRSRLGSQGVRVELR